MRIGNLKAMSEKSWGSEIWEEKAKAHDDISVILGTGARKSGLDRNTRSTLELMTKNFLSRLPAPSAATPVEILDVGTGPAARFAIVLAERNYKVVGLDGSTTALDRARKAAAAAGQRLEFQQADFAEFDLKRQFDALFCVETFFHLPSHLALLSFGSFHRHLKPGGLMFIQFSVMNEPSLGFLAFSFFYRSVFLLLRPIYPLFGKKAFHVTVTRHTEAEVEDIAKRTGFEVIWKQDGYYLFRKTS